MKPFDLVTCPLEGVNLIEASAGTGKTYALAGLYLRFLLEKKMTAKQILVITFTNAATAELKIRIRRMVIDARSAFLSGETSNTFVRQILEKYPDKDERKNITQQLNVMLADYDETAIYTIHGFCQRALADNAFAGGLPFDMEFIADQKKMEKEFVEDFWRRHFYENHPLVIRYALSNGLSPEVFLGLLHLALTRPDIKVLPEDLPDQRHELDGALDELNGQYAHFKKYWCREKATVSKLLKDKALNGQVYGKKTESIIRDVDDLLQYQEMPVPPPLCILKLTAGELQRKTNRNQKTPQHDIFDLCQVLYDRASYVAIMLENYLTKLKKEFLERAKVDFPELKKNKNIMYFDDLLKRTDEAVKDTHGLAEILRKQYSAVLVDEFQDTDPVQYAILQSVFANKNNSFNHTLFYIGDPKQAIYSFRGADIHAYLQAEKGVDARYTMTSNWRSEKSLINAINLMFGKPSKAFVYDEIKYTSVNRPEEQKAKPLSIEGDDPAGLYWWFLPGGEDGKPAGIKDARFRIIQAVIREISRLLKASAEKKARIGDHPLSAGDIAVLVRKNSEASAFKNALLNAGIPSVVYSSESVYSSRQADDLRRLMMGILHFDHEGYLFSAVNTPFFACSANDIAASVNDNNLFERWREIFERLNDSWHRKGFLAMFLGLLEIDGVRVRIAALPDGERCLTNYVHLAQLLFQKEKEAHLQPSDLLIKFEEMMMSEDNKQEEEQQKLETDGNCVRIVTVHRSKGLEYPIVFCPFAWENVNKNNKGNPVVFHDEKNNWQAVADLGSENQDVNLLKAEREILAEDCRLLYVALTRAKSRCYFITGNIRYAVSGAVNYLFDQYSTDHHNKTSKDSDMIEAMRSFTDGCEGDIRIECMGKYAGELQRLIRDKEENVLSCPSFNGHIRQGWKIASYTTLAKSIQEEMGWDEEDRSNINSGVTATVKTEEGIRFFPYGATSGTLLHEILEKINFSRVDDDRTKSIITDTLARFNYPEAWHSPVLDMIQTLVNMKLRKTDGVEFRLSQIESHAFRTEMEFYFPLQDISARQITSILDQQERIRGMTKEIRERRKLNLMSVTGFLRGFVDLVFQHDGRYYLADWKSNYLGERDEDYEPDKLEREIFAALYDLQYMIYAVALDRYLRGRIPDYTYEKYFGGVYYFFLRGINPGCPATRGVYFDRPDQRIIEKMSTMMLKQTPG